MYLNENAWVRWKFMEDSYVGKYLCWLLCLWLVCSLICHDNVVILFIRVCVIHFVLTGVVYSVPSAETVNVILDYSILYRCIIFQKNERQLEL